MPAFVNRPDFERALIERAASPFRSVSDIERRSRLGVRHALAARATDLLAAVRAVVCFHATESTSVYVSAFARAEIDRADIERALYAERSVVRQLAMRRTVFAFPRELMPAVLGSAAARVTAQQTRSLARDVEAAGIARDGMTWVQRACARTLAVLRDTPATTAQLRERLPALRSRVRSAGATAATATSPASARVLLVLAASGAVVRGENIGDWARPRHVWTTAEDWLGTVISPLSESEGYAELVRRWLFAYGPGTEADLAWWLGATKSSVRRALVEVDAVSVSLDDGSAAWLLPDDVREVRTAERWAALLPALDPTTMGWFGRGFYVDAAVTAAVFDRNGNARPTAWWNGRIVGGWAQARDGTVTVIPATDLSRSATAALNREAKRLTARLGGHVIRSVFQDVPHGEP